MIPNKPVEPTGTSRFCQRGFGALRRLAPAAHRLLGSRINPSRRRPSFINTTGNYEN